MLKLDREKMIQVAGGNPRARAKFYDFRIRSVDESYFSMILHYNNKVSGIPAAVQVWQTHAARDQKVLENTMDLQYFANMHVHA